MAKMQAVCMMKKVDFDLQSVGNREGIVRLCVVVVGAEQRGQDCYTRSMLQKVSIGTIWQMDWNMMEW